MKTVFMMQLEDREGSLERILGRTRQRGFVIDEVFARRSGGFVDVRLVVMGERDVENLRRQLEKSADICALTIDREDGSTQLPLSFEGLRLPQ